LIKPSKAPQNVCLWHIILTVQGVEIRAWSLILTPLIKHVFVRLLKDKSKFLFLHLKVPDFRGLGVFSDEVTKHYLEKIGVMSKKGVEIRALDGMYLFSKTKTF